MNRESILVHGKSLHTNYACKILYFRENLCLSSLTSFFKSVRESAHRMKYL